MRPTTAPASLQRVVVTELGRDIAAGRLRAGEVIVPDEVEKRFDVSRTVVREAFRSLEARGMIRARHRSGTRVEQEQYWNLLDPDVIDWRGAGPSAQRQLEELLVLREAVEPMAASLAALHASADEVAALHDHAERMAAAARDNSPSEYMLADDDFHTILVGASGNGVLAQLLHTISATLRSRYGGALPVFTDATARAVERHQRLAAAVAARDGETAAEEARALVREAQAEAVGRLAH
jgi:DNA-binding FadR family transcriptional regulator